MEPLSANPAVALPVRGLVPACRNLIGWLRQWAGRGARALHRSPRHLELCESVSLGEKRFVAVIRYDEQQFLIGGTASSMALISRLNDASREASGGEGDHQ